MTVIDDLANKLESSLSLFTTFKIDLMPPDDNSLTLRRAPSGPAENFLDYTRDDNIMIQVLVKNIDQKTAVDTIEKITDFMGNKLRSLLSSDGSYQFISSDVYTLPTFVEKTDRGSYLYIAMYNVRVFKP